jgi:hypothetical protein
MRRQPQGGASRTANASHSRLADDRDNGNPTQVNDIDSKAIPTGSYQNVAFVLPRTRHPLPV